MTHRFTRLTLATPYIRASFNTLDKHAARGTFNAIAAMRLLRSTVRDIAPNIAADKAQHIACELLTHWRNTHNNGDTEKE